MAERRMFSKSIVLSDAFLSLPASARCLYFSLGMLADDDGFVGNIKSIQKMIRARSGDVSALINARFIIYFQSGVVLIKHWRINNFVRGDRYKSTNYQKELSKIMAEENGAYTEREEWREERYTDGIPMVYQTETNGIPRLGKDRLGKVRLGKGERACAREAPPQKGAKEQKKNIFDSVMEMYEGEEQ